MAQRTAIRILVALIILASPLVLVVLMVHERALLTRQELLEFYAECWAVLRAGHL